MTVFYCFVGRHTHDLANIRLFMSFRQITFTRHAGAALAAGFMSSCEADVPSHRNFDFRPPARLREPPTRKYFNANLPSRLRSGPPQPRQSTCSR